jgi:hypothetical protein
MSVFNSRTLVLVATSTAVGFLGDVATYSVAASKGSALRVVFPKGKELVSVLLLGVVGGFILDYAAKKVEDSLKTKEEKALDELVSGEKEKIYSGIIKNLIPTKVDWASS